VKLKALLVDHDYPARQALRHTLGDIDKVEVIGEATGFEEALALIDAIDYHVVFLEVTLPGNSGLELAKTLQEREHRPYIVFVTAYAEYAVSAFAVDAADYLLKPVATTELNRVVEKVYRLSRERQMISKITTTAREGKEAKGAGVRLPYAGAAGKIDRIPAGRQGKTILVTEADIFFAFTLQESVYIKTESEKLFTRLTLKELEKRLAQYSFFRTHRCYLVNLHKVREIVPFFNGTYNLIVADKEKSEVPVSRAQAKKLKKVLGL